MGVLAAVVVALLVEVVRADLEIHQVHRHLKEITVGVEIVTVLLTEHLEAVAVLRRLVLHHLVDHCMPAEMVETERHQVLAELP